MKIYLCDNLEGPDLREQNSVVQLSFCTNLRTQRLQPAVEFVLPVCGGCTKGEFTMALSNSARY